MDRVQNNYCYSSACCSIFSYEFDFRKELGYAKDRDYEVIDKSPLGVRPVAKWWTFGRLLKPDPL